MSKAKIKKSKQRLKKPTSLPRLDTTDFVLVVLSALVVLGVGASAISDLHVQSRFYICSSNDMRAWDSQDIFQLHHAARVELWAAGVVLSLLIIAIAYRNKYAKAALIISLIYLSGYWLLEQIGLGIGQGISCLNW